MQRIATYRTSEDLLQEDDSDLSESFLGCAQTSAVLVIGQRRKQENKFSTRDELAAQSAMTLIEGKWKVPILCQLQTGPMYLGELKRRLSPISKKVLNQHLRQMVKHGLIIRTDYAGKVPRVEYALANPLGYSVLDLLQAVANWADLVLKGRGRL
jgi:DNA-binding HxlR family transcriptional regulator